MNSGSARKDHEALSLKVNCTIKGKRKDTKLPNLFLARSILRKKSWKFRHGVAKNVSQSSARKWVLDLANDWGCYNWRKNYGVMPLGFWGLLRAFVAIVRITTLIKIKTKTDISFYICYTLQKINTNKRWWQKIKYIWQTARFSRKRLKKVRIQKITFQYLHFWQ